MARGVNRAIILGNLGADPEARYTPSGTAVCNIRVATTEAWKDRQTGEQQERTEWHRVVAFNRLAEIMGEYLTKGSKVYIEGKLQTRKWQDQSGNDRYTTEIVANDMQILSGRGGQQSGGGSAPAQGAGGAPSGGGAPAGGDQGPADDFDDIPFFHAWLYPVAGIVTGLIASTGVAPGGV